ncbi:replicative DNA helicase [Prevotella histicola]|uniref:replicative DNA helicase n=1 Tax=Prevotella histicola TaxID=470565 RepID=UPI00241F5940|nr:replicative DNA helicase [Prevotella histicola]
MVERSNSKSNRRSKQAPIDTTFGHLQPQATDIEKVVLGALMIDKDAFTVVSEIIKPETFYEARHQKIYEAIQSLNLQEKPVDIMTVAEELRHKGTLEEIGGPAYVVELSSNVASSAHIEYHAHILAQKFLARQLIQFASMIETDAFDETVDVDELMQKAEGTLFEISQKNMLQDYVQIDTIVEQAHQLLLQAANRDGGLTGVPSGFHKLDEITAGWQASDLVIIAGRPAMGKTSFALSIAKNIAVDYREPIAFFSLEMNNVQLVNRLISNVCSVPGNKILNGQLTPDEWERFDSNIRKMQGAPIYVDDTPGLSIFELRTKARRLVREHGIKILMIDYLQLMNANGMRFNSRQEEVSTISRSLKGLAKELNIPVLALSQLSRAVEQRDGAEGKRPQLSDLRESGAIEQDADMVLFVHRPEYYHILQDDKGNDLHGMAQIIIAKHRKGATGDVLLNFRGEYTRFANPEDTDFTAPLPEDQFGGEIVGSKINEDPMPPNLQGFNLLFEIRENARELIKEGIYFLLIFLFDVAVIFNSFCKFLYHRFLALY